MIVLYFVQNRALLSRQTYFSRKRARRSPRLKIYICQTIKLDKNVGKRSVWSLYRRDVRVDASLLQIVILKQL